MRNFLLKTIFNTIKLLYKLAAVLDKNKYTPKAYEQVFRRDKSLEEILNLFETNIGNYAICSAGIRSDKSYKVEIIGARINNSHDNSNVVICVSHPNGRESLYDSTLLWLEEDLNKVSNLKIKD